MHGAIPTSWSTLRALRALWLRPGNYQMCGGVPLDAPFSICREIDTACEPPPPTSPLPVDGLIPAGKAWSVHVYI